MSVLAITLFAVCVLGGVAMDVRSEALDLPYWKPGSAIYAGIVAVAFGLVGHPVGWCLLALGLYRIASRQTAGAWLSAAGWAPPARDWWWSVADSVAVLAGVILVLT